MLRIASFLLTSVVIGIPTVYPLDNGLGLVPQMGFLSWQRYRCVTDCVNFPTECIHENLFKRIADLMVSEGFLDVGYEYVIIDDCWLSKERDSEGRLQPDPERFPSGIKALADYIHAKGLKFGIYEDYGTSTCGGYPGMAGHLETDAQTFADWEVDYLKIDGCNWDAEDLGNGYIEFGDLLNATGRPIFYSCEWPLYQELNGIEANYTLIAQYCNSWRNYYDIEDSYDRFMQIVDYFILNQDRFIPVAGPGHWNDPDMLLIGNYGLSLDQSRAQMAIWAMMASPLLISTELANIQPDAKAILQNSKVIAINQDPLGIQGQMITNINNIDVWIRPITPVIDGQYSYAVAFVSRRIDGIPYPVNVTLQDLGLENPQGYLFQDIFKDDAPFAVSQDSFLFTTVVPTGCVLYRADLYSKIH